MSCQPNCGLYLLVLFVVEPGMVQPSFPNWTHLLTYISLSLSNHDISKHELNSYNVQNIWQGLMEGRKSPFVQAFGSWVERGTINSTSLLHLNKINGEKWVRCLENLNTLTFVIHKGWHRNALHSESLKLLADPEAGQFIYWQHWTRGRLPIRDRTYFQKSKIEHVDSQVYPAHCQQADSSRAPIGGAQRIYR